MAVDADGSPVTVSWSGDARRNVIVWMDHRAVKQAERINACNSPVLQYCGGALSPEMEPPKVCVYASLFSSQTRHKLVLAECISIVPVLCYYFQNPPHWLVFKTGSFCYL